MKKQVIYIIIFVTIIVGAYIVLLSVKDMNKPGEESIINGKDTSKEEYIYKDELLELGYSIDEIDKIKNKLTNSDVKNYLLDTKYDNLVEFMNIPYFNTNNISRYNDYYKKNPSLSYEDVIVKVEIGLDNEFYTNINILDEYKDIKTIVNKYNMLPEDYSFDDLVTISKPYSKDGNRRIRSVAIDDLKKMIDAANKDNITLFVVSGFRTNNDQTYLFNNTKNTNGLNYALMYSAKPGYSEHQLGLAVDLYTTQAGFEKTKQYAWLKENAYKYGFIERYPKGKESITGFAFEPWHYRYIGIDIAKKIYEENITLEEYMVKYK